MKRLIQKSPIQDILTIMVIFPALFFIFSQGRMVKGSQVFQSPLEPTLTGAGNLIIQSGSSLNNQGSLVLLGDITNNGTSSLGTGFVKFAGTVNQTIGGTNIFQNTEVNNSNGITLNGTLTVNGTLTLTNGLITLGSSNLLLGTGATISGSPGNTRMIVPNGRGQLQKQFSAAGSFTFPVGDNSGIAEYSPVTLTFTSGTFAAGSRAGINLANLPYPGSAESYLKRYWNVYTNGITSYSCNAQFNYIAPADIVGSESEIYCLRGSPMPVVYFDPANTTLHQLTANGITMGGTFTGHKINRTLYLTSIMLEGLYDGGSIMRIAADDIGDHFLSDTADVMNVELHKTTDYSVIMYTAPNVKLSVAGTAFVPVPTSFNDSYYVTIRHRNSIETTTAAPVQLSGTSVNYSFGTPSNVYGNNLGTEIDGTAVIYAGDDNQDGIVDGGDLSDVGNFATAAATGYIPQDINGDGLVDGSDLSMTGNNATLAISLQTP